MRSPSKDGQLPPWAIQIFGMTIVAAMAAWAIIANSIAIGLACITFATGCVGVSAFGRATREFERAKEEVERVLSPPTREDAKP